MENDIINKALAQGLDGMLQGVLHTTQMPWFPGHANTAVPRAGMVDLYQDK